MIYAHRNVLDPNLIQDALRHIHLDIITRGLDPVSLKKYQEEANWFPHLRWSTPMLHLQAAVHEHLPVSREEIPCDPQIVLQFPHVGEAGAVSYHVDREPDWAVSDGLRYSRVAGVPLTPSTPANGGVRFKYARYYTLNPGDIIEFSADEPHSAGYNMTGEVRYAVYFRWVL